MDFEKEKTTTDEYFCDFILPIGRDCRVAGNLRNNLLRDFSAPLDWMGHYSLDTILRLIQNGFANFFTECEINREDPKGIPGKLWVNDTLNHLRTLHHFPADQPFNESHKKFTETMRKRAKRLEEQLRSSSRLVLLGDREESQEELSAFLRSFSSLYPHLTIRLANFRHNDAMPYDDYEEKAILNEAALSFVEYTLNDTCQGEDVWLGNSFLWGKILSKYITSSFAKKREEWSAYRKQNAQLVIFGADKDCVVILNWLARLDIAADSIAVKSMTDNPWEINRIRVMPYSLYPHDAALLISSRDKTEAKKASDLLSRHGFSNITCIDSNMNLIQAELIQ